MAPTYCSTVALAVALISTASLADTVEDPCSRDCAGQGAATSQEAQIAGEEGADQPRRYSWDDLLEIVPELREYELGFRRGDVDDNDQQQYLVCRKYKVTWTRIPQRRCAPLRDFLVYMVAQRRRAEQARINIQLLPSAPPPVIRQ